MQKMSPALQLVAYKMETTTHVQRKVWDVDDDYLIIEVQVDESEFKKGDKVKVVIEKV